jgi:hypothetical protein
MGFEFHLLESETMKIKIIIALVATAGILGLAGCKPKATTVSGQVFIVTKGAENFKLGAVEILLVEKSQVTNFLQKKQPAIESEMASKRQELTNAEQKVMIALNDDLNTRNDYNSMISNRPYETNADYVKIKSQLAIVSRLKDTFQQQYDSLVVKVESAIHDGGFDMDKFNALLAQRTSAQQSLSIENKIVDSLQAKLDEFQNLAEAEANEMLSAASSRVNIANSHVATVKTNLDNSPTVADYLEDFLPVVVQKTLSDSDGKFSFTYPRDKMFTIFAHAQRMVLDKTETYYWLVDAPTNAETTQIFLSNNNLVFVDPNGYFKLKPKEMQQVLSK